MNVYLILNFSLVAIITVVGTVFLPQIIEITDWWVYLASSIVTFFIASFVVERWISKYTNGLLGKILFMQNPRPDEIEIKNSQRIGYLTKNHFKETSTREEGWTILYLDPLDSRYWELSYPHSERHGGGPPLLKCLSSADARKLYSLN